MPGIRRRAEPTGGAFAYANSNHPGETKNKDVLKTGIEDGRDHARVGSCPL
jgi:hypothetical protein